MVSEAKRCWGMFYRKNNGSVPAGQRRYFYFRITGSEAEAILDSLYKTCYNKRSDNNKNVICHQSPKFALYGVFAFMGIKSCGTPENAVQRIYIKNGNTKQPEIVRRTRTSGKGIPIYKQEITLLKICHAVTKWLQLSGSLDSRRHRW